MCGVEVLVRSGRPLCMSCGRGVRSFVKCSALKPWVKGDFGMKQPLKDFERVAE